MKGPLYGKVDSKPEQSQPIQSKGPLMVGQPVQGNVPVEQIHNCVHERVAQMISFIPTPLLQYSTAASRPPDGPSDERALRESDGTVQICRVSEVLMASGSQCASSGPSRALESLLHTSFHLPPSQCE